VTEVRFAPRTVGGVVTYETILAVDNAELLLRPGMTATAEIVVGRIDEALLVPNAALRFTPSAARHHQQEEASKGLVESLIPRPMASDGRRRGKAPRVWVLRDGAVVPVDLEIGSSDGTWTVVTKGELHVGDVVITDEQTKVDS
jgi:HlyD family secretion protein